jgi:putative hemolysin
MIIIILSIFAVLCILIGGFFSGAETAFISTDKSMLRSLAGKKNKHAVTAENILAEPSRMLATTLIGTNLFFVCATTLVTLIVADFVPREWQSVITTLIMTPVLLVFAELVPKSMGRGNSQNYTLAAAPVISLAQKILKPFVVSVSFFSSGALRLFGVKESHNRFSVTREEVRTLAEISAEHGLIGDVERKMINRVFELNEIIPVDLEYQYQPRLIAYLFAPFLPN